MPLDMMDDRRVIGRLYAAAEAASGLLNNTAYVNSMDLRWVLDKLLTTGVIAAANTLPDEPEAAAPPAPPTERKWVNPSLLRIVTNGVHTLYMERKTTGHWMYLMTRGDKEIGCGMAMIDPAECERLGLAAYNEVVS